MSPRVREPAAPQKQEKAAAPAAAVRREEARDAGVETAAPAFSSRRDAGLEEVLPGGVGGPAPVLERATRYGDAVLFDDVFLIADEAVVYEALDRLTAERGERGVDTFVASFETQIEQDERSAHADESAADVSAGWSENIAIARARASESTSRAEVERAILPVVTRVNQRLHAENRTFLAEFELAGNDLVRGILAQSDAVLDEQVRRYGIRGTQRSETYFVARGDREVARQRTVTDYSLGETADTASLGHAATELAAKRTEIATLERQRVYDTKRTRDGEGGWSTETVLRWDGPLESSIVKNRREYEDLRLRRAREHPILRVADEKLAGLTARDEFPSPRAANAIMEAVGERRASIQEVREQIGGRYSIWSQPLVLAMTSQRYGVVAGSRQDKLVRDTFRTYKSPREQALQILTAVVLMLGFAAALFTLGGSVVVAGAITAAIAGIDFAVLGDAIAQYQVDAAATETDLDPEKSASQTKPTGTEILLDTVSVLADVIALGAEVRAAGTGARAASAAAHAPEIVRFGAEEGAAAARLTEQELEVLRKEGMTGFAGSEGRLARTTGPAYLVRIGKAGEGAGFSRWGFGIFKDEAAAEAYARWLSRQSEEVLRRWTAIPEMWSRSNRSAFETIKVWKLSEGGVAYVAGRVGPQLEAAKVFADVSALKSGAAEALEVARAAREAPVAGGGSQVLLLGDIKSFSQVGSEIPVLAASGKPATAELRAAAPVVKAAVEETKSVAATETKSVATESKAVEDVQTTAPASKGPEWFTKPEEIQLTRAEFERALAHGYVPQAFNELSSAIHEIGERAAAVVTQNPRFIQAVNNREWAVAGTLFHSEACRQGQIVAQSLGPGIQMRFEQRLAGGASRLDILASTPTGLVEVDWKTTGRSGLSWRVRTDEMPRHAAHVVQDLGVPLSEQLSKSWVEYARPYMPNVTWPRG